MRASVTFAFVAVLVSTSAKTPAGQTNSSSNAGAVASMERKLQHVKDNAAAATPDRAPTEFSEQEINAYFAAGKVKLPAGVQSVTFQGQAGIVTATARVDFDQLRAKEHASNPLLAVFSGIHDVVVAAHAHGSGGRGFVQVDSVSLDGVEIPQFVLQLFVEKYLQPKYPSIGLDSRFTLPARVDSVIVGLHKLTITQE
jgi:hypothetical protein